MPKFLQEFLTKRFHPRYDWDWCAIDYDRAYSNVADGFFVVDLLCFGVVGLIGHDLY